MGPRRGGSPGGERRARRSGEGCPMGPPAGRQPRWGKAGAPKRRGLPDGAPAGRQTRWGKAGAPKQRGLPDGAPGGAAAPVGKGGRAEAARAARSAAEGQHEWGAGAPAVAGCGANGKGRQDKPICLSSGCNKDQDYLNLRLRAASDFFLRLTEGFS